MRPAPMIVLVLSACSGSELVGPESSVDVTPIGDVHVPDSEATQLDIETSEIAGGTCSDALSIVSVEPWVGGGVAVTVRLRGADGSPGTGTHATLDGGDAVIAAARSEPGITALVLDGDDADARALVAAMPEGERFVVWNGPTLIADATADRAFVDRRIRAATAAATIDAATWRTITAALRDLDGEGATTPKALVVDGVPPSLVTDEAFVLGADLAPRIVAGRVGLARVGACPAPGVRNVELTVDGVTCNVRLPEPLDYVADLPCVADAAARGDWPYGERVELVFTADELAVWQDRHAARSELGFTGGLKLGDAQPVPARLHFRGQTSLDCERKSYNVNLDGSTARPLMPGVWSDELYLVSMCKDVGYYNQLLGDQLARALGVFPLRWRLVTLTIGALNQGVYLMLQDPIEGLKDGHVALSEVVRRRLDQDGNPPEVEYVADDDSVAAFDRYQQLVTVAEDPDALVERLDLDAYFRWMALAMALENGDYVDEIFFHASDEGLAAPRYRVLGWDPDDLWSACHRNGRDAIPDTNGILYCAEGNIDHVLFDNPVAYERFIDQLEVVLAELPVERLVAEMAVVRDALFAAVKDDATAAAMVELTATTPSAATVDGFRAAVGALMDDDLAHAATWLEHLRERVAAYREANP